MKLEKQLTIIAVVSIIITMVLFFVLEKKADSGFFNTAVELLLMAGMTFLVIAINFFAIRFFVSKIAGFFRKKHV
jgi:hypothetical protein